ncbi:MAG: DUF4331 family protein [Panacagrimonas sp.]
MKKLLGAGRTGLMLATTLATAMAVLQAGRVAAADHGDSPAPSHDQATDIGDVFFFLDPTDNDFAVIAMDAHGFIVPSENSNLGAFDPAARFNFPIENTGDAAPDAAITVDFGPQTARNAPQTARVRLVGRGVSAPAAFSAPTTVSSAVMFEPAVIAPVVTTDAASNISVFAGLRDDPFFFDIPSELRYRTSRFNNAIDPASFSRARDSFAGYNINFVVLRVPVALIKGTGNVIGVAGAMQRRKETTRSRQRVNDDDGAFFNVDRMGIPAVNTVFVGSRPAAAPGCEPADPTEAGLAKKDRFNRSRTTDDARGVFATDIVNNLQCLRTGAAATQFFAGAAVTHGDYLRLDVTKANASLGVPTTPGVFPPGGFADLISFNGSMVPNGRRPGDDTIDIIVTGVNNFAQVNPTGGCPLNPAAFCVDRVDTNDRPFLATFPFFAPPHQPFATPGEADGTRN